MPLVQQVSLGPSVIADCAWKDASSSKDRDTEHVPAVAGKTRTSRQSLNGTSLGSFEQIAEASAHEPVNVASITPASPHPMSTTTEVAFPGQNAVQT